MKTVRKAVWAGVGAGVSTVIGLVTTNGLPNDADAFGRLIGAFLAAAIPVGWATYKIRNAGSVNGSYPR